jgi:hypothetical protein
MTVEDKRMMRLLLKRSSIALIVLALVLLSGGGAVAQDTPTEEPDTTSVPISEPFEVTFGSGSFDLLSPMVGLSDLPSYRATLMVSFQGTIGEQPAAWTRTYTLLVSQDTPARQLTIDASDASDGPLMRAEIDDVFYEWQEGSLCVASVPELSTSPSEVFEPASFLNSVIGAEEAGSETVNGITSTRYTFDESAQAASGIAESTGELWIASDGGYLVRYVLGTTGGPAYFGQGIEGTLTWDYQLEEVGLPLVIELPADCPPALLDFPMLPDAADVLEFPGSTSYTTTSGLEETLAFYEEQVSALGGQVLNSLVSTESTALLGFTLGDQSILLVANSDLAGTIIELYPMNDAAQLDILAEVPDERGVVAEPTQPSTATAGCEPGTDSVPITADASSIQDMGMALSYMTAMSMAEVTAFYEEQLAALGAQVSSPMPATDFMAMLNVQQNALSYAITLAPMGNTTSVTISAMTMQTTFTACTPASSNLPAADVSSTPQPAEIDDCPRSVLPLLPDASNIQEIMGVITYTTATSVPETVTFYEEQFTALGAQVFMQVPATDSMASPMFMLENQPIVITILAESDGSTTVSISIMGNNPFRGAAPCG